MHISKGPFNLLKQSVPLLLVATLAWLSYQPGITGDLFYDDLSFLGSLAEIETTEEAVRFVNDGAGGPLGRRLALISFLPHADGWPDTATNARQINVLIHLANGLLLFAIGYMILRLRAESSQRVCYWITLSAAWLWLVMPFLASTSLITVQRWTGLAHLFGLIGLAVFVYGYFLQPKSPGRTLLAQGLGLGLGTLLALLTKESGALFPIYALVFDQILLRDLPGSKRLRWVRAGVLLLGLLALLIYLSPFYRDWFAVSAFRGWSSFERLQTQIVLLWQYLYLAFFPQPTAFGPFHDDVELIRGWLLPVLALSGFVLLTVLAVLWRKRSPWPLFALLWFFAGHLIESTVIHLELMFEHRNYLALYGFCLALAAIAWRLPGRYARLGPTLLAVYGLMLWAILLGTTTIWGNRLEAAENWAQRHPNSPRAILHLSSAYYQALGNASYSLPALDRAAEGCAGCTDVRMQAMLYACDRGAAEKEMANRFEQVRQSARDGRASIALLDSFYPLQELLARNSCQPLTAEDALDLVRILLQNPAFSASSYQVHLLFHAAYFAKELNQYEAAMAYLNEAEGMYPQVVPILQQQVHLLMKAGRYDAALDAIERRRPLENRTRLMSDAILDELETAVREATAAGP